jgi:hypothetical protein
MRSRDECPGRPTGRPAAARTATIAGLALLGGGLLIASAAPAVASPGVIVAPPGAGAPLRGSMRGVIVSTVDGSPIRGASALAALHLSSGAIQVHVAATRADGTFALRELEPGRYAVAADKRGWQGRAGAPALAAVLAASATTLPHPLTLTPVGYVHLTFRSLAGRPLAARYVSLSVDGCAAAPALGRSRICGVRGTNDVSADRGLAQREYVLAPGTHRLRVLVRSPLDGTVRILKRTVHVRGGDAYTTTLRTLRFRADPVTRARIVRVTERADAGVTVSVRLPSYTDGAAPRLRTTLRIGGVPVAGTTVRYVRSGTGATIARVTIPAERASAAGRLRAVVHGTAAYAAATSAPLSPRGAEIREEEALR